jgi:uncharacterized protein YllA (UPF0747 family)
VVDLDTELKTLQGLYNELALKAGSYDQTLQSHVLSLHRMAEKKLEALQKKMQRAQRRKFSEEQQKIEKLRDELFPGGSLQERTESVWTFYAKYGSVLLEEMLLHTLPVRQEWGIISVGDEIE